MKSEFKLIIGMLIVVYMLVACKSNANDASRIEFYIMRHVDGANHFILDESPIFTGEDILSYEWDTHTITFIEEFMSSIIIDETEDSLINGGSSILSVYYPDQFAVYLDGEKLYTGYIKPQIFISFMPMGPTISDTKDGIIISSYATEPDLRNNDKLYEALKENDLLR